MAVRLSTLAEIKVLSLSTYLRDKNINFNSGNAGAEILQALQEFRNIPEFDFIQARKNAESGATGQPLFKTVGIARNVRIDEDFGTQPIYGIGSPTRPRLVPNNFSVNVTCDRLQLDKRHLLDFMLTPEYWYSHAVQREVGIDDFLLYTYFFVKSKEDGNVRYDIYALMPRSASRTISSGDVMIAHNVTLAGFKYSYEQAWLDAQNLVDESLTVEEGLQ
jgi:hypothetical protein